PRALVERVEAGVRRDPVQPRANRRAALVRLAPAPRAQERLLDEVLGLLERPEQAVAVDVQLAAMRLDAGGEGVLVERPEVIGHGAHGVYDGGRPESSSPGVTQHHESAATLPHSGGCLRAERLVFEHAAAAYD